MVSGLILGCTGSNSDLSSFEVNEDMVSVGSAISPVPEENSASSEDTKFDMSKPWSPSVNSEGYAMLSSLPHIDERTPEIMMQWSGAIARVRLLEVEEKVHHPSTDLTDKPYSVGMVFKFRVLEWIRGGNNEVITRGEIGIELADGDTEEEARWKAKYYFDARDSQFDNRDAILMFQDVPPDKDNVYSIGCLCVNDSFSPWARWLPLASPSEVSGSNEEQRFLWRTYINPYRPSGVAGQSEENTISLNVLRRLAGLSEKDLDERSRSVLGYAVVNESPPAEMDLDHFAAISRTHGSDNWIDLAWANLGTADSGVEGYRILRRKQSDGNFIELANVSANSLTGHYEDGRDIQPETKYIYRLRAYGKDGGIADARVAITTVAALESLDAPTASPTTIPTATPTLAPAATATQTAAPTAIPEATATPTPDILASNTPTPTATATIEPTLTATPEPPPSGGVTGQIDTPTPTHTPEPTPTATYEPPPPGGVSGQGDDAPTPTPASTATSTPEAAPTHTPTPAP